MEIYVLHGKGSSPSKVEWLSRPLKKFGSVVVPLFDFEIKEGIELLKGKKIGCIAGHSRGGTAALLASVLMGINCVIAVASPIDRIYQRDYLCSFGEDKIQHKLCLDLKEIPEEELKETSPIYYLDKLNNVLIIHGDSDDIVPLWHSKTLYEKLNAMGKNVRLEIIKGMKHTPMKSHYSQIDKVITDFMASLITPRL